MYTVHWESSAEERVCKSPSLEQFAENIHEHLIHGNGIPGR